MARRNQFVYGHHGTTKELAEAILTTGFEQSERESDWLGFGVYFWEDSPSRARLWGEQKFPGHPVCILDAKIALERCLNLADPEGAARLKPYYGLYITALGATIAASLKSTERGNRQLDCRVINFACERWKEDERTEIHVVRGAFKEGNPLFPGRDVSPSGTLVSRIRRWWRSLFRDRDEIPPSQIHDLNHVQLAVRECCAILDFQEA